MKAPVLFAFALLLAGCARAPSEGIGLTGGCAADRSPYLVEDIGVVRSRISYCDQGDASVSRIEMVVPAQALAGHHLVVAGYPSSPGVSVTLVSDSGESSAVTTVAGETWTALPVPEALAAGTGNITLTVDDQSTESRGWAGVGLAMDRGPTRDFRWAAILSILIFAVILARDLWKLHRGSDHAAAAPRRGSWFPAALTTGLLGALTFTAVLFRRPDQIFHPYLWVEEGTVSLPQFLENGAAFLFDPVAGYLIVPSKLLFLMATAFPVEHFPLALAIGSVVFCWLTLTVLALAPSHLKATASIAAFVLVLPTASENYFTAHYAFWFGSLLLIPPLFWKEGPRRRLPFRVGLIMLGGLSSPLVVALLPAFAYRLLIQRTAANVVQVACAGIAAVVQLYLVKSSGTHGASFDIGINPRLMIEKFFGLFWSAGDGRALLFGIAIIGVLLAFVALANRENRKWALLGLYCLGASILITIARVQLELLHPIIGAPRYFFYPYIFLGVVLLGLLPGTRAGTVLCVVIMAFCLARFPQMGPQPHAPISWKHQLDACVAADGDYRLPIHYYGGTDQIWHVDLDSEDCRRIRSGWVRQVRPAEG